MKKIFKKIGKYLLILFCIGILINILEYVGVDEKYLAYLGIPLVLIFFYYLFRFYRWLFVKVPSKVGNKVKEIKKKTDEAVKKGFKIHIEYFSKKFELIDIKPLEEFIRKNEKLFEKVKEGEMHKFIRSISFLSNYTDYVEQRFREDSKGLYRRVYDQRFPTIVKATISQNEYRKKSVENIYTLIYQMMQYFIENNMTDYYLIYEILDEEGIFQNKFQRDVSSNLKQINSTIHSINNNLERINSKLNYQNLVLTYNTIQLHNIKKSLKQ